MYCFPNVDPRPPSGLGFEQVEKCFRTAPTGSFPGRGSCTNEILKVCLDDTETLELFDIGSGKLGQSQSARGGEPVFHADLHDCSPKEGWRHQVNGHWDEFLTIRELQQRGQPTSDCVVHRCHRSIDHVHRSAMVTKLLEIPVCMVLFHSSGTQTVNKWTDTDGVHDSHQHEDGEQGHPPHAFAL